MKSSTGRLGSILSIALLAVGLAGCQSTPTVEFNPDKGQHIIILGNTFAERMQHFNYFETLLYKSFPDRELTVRNMGWSADEIGLQPRPYNFGSADEHLTQQQAGWIIACFGLNEAFKGPDSLPAFQQQLSDWLSHLQQQRYDGKSAPRVILVSPIAHENLGGFLPDPAMHNRNLKLYTRGMSEVAKRLSVPFIDLYTPTSRLMEGEKDSLTINGIHLNDSGYRLVGEILARALGLGVSNWENTPDFTGLKTVIDQKNRHFFYRYRAVNGEYIYGSRKEPWVQPAGGPLYYPSEFKKLDGMILALDSAVWAGSKGSAGINLRKVDSIVSNAEQIRPETESTAAPLAEQFLMKKGFKVELFASEKDFPIDKPVKITFDPQGRLWVATMPSYPQYFPGSPPNDKIIILEDTDHDGKADKHTVFADSLYLPLGFELGHGGVYVTQAPDFVFLKDTDGDGKADFCKTLLHGFGTEDSHHSISAHTWGPDGALYMHMGTFLHTQVETPYGPVRSAYGETWRYDPLAMKLEPYVSYPYANPWGNVFTANGTHLIGDVSTGMNYFAPPLTVATDYPIKHLPMQDFLTLKIRPKTCGMEIVSSRNFPDEDQGDVLFNTFIAFQGVTQHGLKEAGSGIIGHEKEPLLQSKDPQFRPVDLQFGPDGALYIVDWFNKVINHGERGLRDPERDQTHGRIWRVTYTGKKTLQPVDLSRLGIQELLDQFKVYEDRHRYRTRIRLTELPDEEVMPALSAWVASLNPADPQYEHQQLEALWVYQQRHHPSEKLLTELLRAKDHNIRAAATRVLYYWNSSLNNSFEELVRMSADSSQRVRVEAVAALSHFKTSAAVKALLEVSQRPVDYYLEYALKEAFKYLKPVWMEMFRKDPGFLAEEPEKAEWLLGPLASAEALALPGFFNHDPEAAKYVRTPLTEADFQELAGVKAVADFRARHSKMQLGEKDAGPQEQESGSTTTGAVEISTVPHKMAFDKTILTVTAGTQVSLVFKNPDEMVHNLVIGKPGSSAKIGQAADKMAGDKDGYEKNFVPRLPEVLYATPLVGAGGTYQLDFKAPAPGEYPFLCTFPGHWQIMNGVLKVIP